MHGAGARARSRVRFDARAPDTDDGYGNQLEDWSAITTVWAGFRPKFGREQLQAGRLESTMQGTLTVLRSSATAAITAAARVVFLTGPYSGKTCQVRSIVPTPDNREIEFLIEEGVGI